MTLRRVFIKSTATNQSLNGPFRQTWRATKYPRLLMTLMSLWLINTKDKLLFDTSCTICATGLHRTHELTKGAFIIYLEGGLWSFPYFFLSFFWSPPDHLRGFFPTPPPLKRCWFIKGKYRSPPPPPPAHKYNMSNSPLAISKSCDRYIELY